MDVENRVMNGEGGGGGDEAINLQTWQYGKKQQWEVCR